MRIKTLNDVESFSKNQFIMLARPLLNCLYAMPPYVIGEEELVKVLSVMKEWFA